MPATDAVTLDVREDILAGRDPFGRIMAAVDSLTEGQSLVLINVFEPRPLYGVLRMRGLEHEAEQTPDGDWRVVFSKPTQ